MPPSSSSQTGDGRGAEVAVDFFRWDVRQPDADRQCARRGRAVFENEASRSQAIVGAALRGCFWARHRTLPGKSEWIARWRHRLTTERALHDSDAAPQRVRRTVQLVVAAARTGRGLAVDEDLPQCPALGGLGPHRRSSSRRCRTSRLCRCGSARPGRATRNSDRSERSRYAPVPPPAAHRLLRAHQALRS